MHHLALTGKFWLRSRISFKESNFGTDKILDAAWKLRSAGRVTGSSSSFVSYIYDKLRRIKCRPETKEVRGEKLFADIQKRSFTTTVKVCLPCISHTLRGAISPPLSKRCLRSSPSCSLYSGWDFLEAMETRNDFAEQMWQRCPDLRSPAANLIGTSTLPPVKPQR